ncbi:hypothetical protein N2152v2_000537 [Parachlorella kessleri]
MLLEHLPALNQKRLVLASASPRRKELLQQLGLKFEVIVSNFEETLSKESVTAAEYATATATHKALDVAQNLLAGHAHLVIGADTVVEYGGHILEKPEDAQDALRVLSMLSGQLHHVHTGVALVVPPYPDNENASGEPAVRSFAVTTAVQFDDVSARTLQAYIESGEPFGKAGSYGIQGLAGSFVKSIEGCYFNVVGFPIHRFSKEVVSLIDEGLLPL